MSDLGKNIGAWTLGVLLLGALGCNKSHDKIWSLFDGLGKEHGPKQPPPPPPPIDPRIDQACLQEQLTPFVESLGAGWPQAYRPTGTVLVAAAGQVLYAHGFGARDDEGGNNTASTSFRVGSVTKGFTAVAILQLAEAGLLTPEDTVGQHLPEYPAVGAGLTLHQLLSHTAGLPNYTNDAELMARRDQPISPEELLATFWELPLEFEPGTQFRYSNSGYAVLGAVIERVTGQTYAEYMQQAVFEPAGLERTVVGDAEGLADRALGYTSDPLGRLVPAFPVDMSTPYAAGAIRSTALDLVRWHRALGGDRLLTAESREQLFTPVLNSYAYGWVIQEREGQQVVWHNGGIDGFASDFVRVPELDLAIVVLLNSDWVFPDSISGPALRCALGQDIPPAPPPTPVELAADQRQRVLGTYRLTATSREQLVSQGLPAELIATLETAAVYEQEGALVFQPVGQGPNVMLALSEADFVLPAVEATLRFSFADGAAPATTVTLEQGGLAVSFER
jgi:CubicO group peptidase (beta-lactamase class C family)